MKKVIIKYFNTRQQNRITLVKLLVEYNNLGLKNAKEKLDLMLDENKPIVCEIDDTKLDTFVKELKELNLEIELL
jgi:ribosomal protein L7/L12